MRGRMVAMALAVILTLSSSGCVRTGVRDYEDWQNAVESGQPCSELFDIRAKLPTSVDRKAVDEDLRRIGCENAGSGRSDSERGR